jgi:hypothetical protein
VTKRFGSITRSAPAYRLITRAASCAANDSPNRMYTDGPITPMRKLSVDLSNITPARNLSVDLSSPALGKLNLDCVEGALSYDGGSISSNSTLFQSDANPAAAALIVEEVRRCSHCFTTQTPQWRRHTHGILLCNGCGLKARRKERRRERTRLADSTTTNLFIASSDFVQQLLLDNSSNSSPT